MHRRAVYVRALSMGISGRGVETYGERAGRVPGHGPPPPTIQCRTLLHEDADNTSPTEGLRVHLPLDLEGIEREEDDLTDASQAVGSEALRSVPM